MQRWLETREVTHRTLGQHSDALRGIRRAFEAQSGPTTARGLAERVGEDLNPLEVSSLAASLVSPRHVAFLRRTPDSSVARSLTFAAEA